MFEVAMDSDNPKIDSTLHQLALEIQALHKRAEALGMFISDRELLTCNQCSLLEDVTMESILLTYYLPKDIGLLDSNGWPVKIPLPADTGLRFEEITPTRFRCPSCGNLIELDPDPFDLDD
jgi:hypothetical protein